MTKNMSFLGKITLYAAAAFLALLMGYTTYQLRSGIGWTLRPLNESLTVREQQLADLTGNNPFFFQVRRGSYEIRIYHYENGIFIPDPLVKAADWLDGEVWQHEIHINHTCVGEILLSTPISPTGEQQVGLSQWGTSRWPRPFFDATGLNIDHASQEVSLIRDQEQVFFTIMASNSPDKFERTDEILALEAFPKELPQFTDLEQLLIFTITEIEPPEFY